MHVPLGKSDIKRGRTNIRVAKNSDAIDSIGTNVLNATELPRNLTEALDVYHQVRFIR